MRNNMKTSRLFLIGVAITGIVAVSCTDNYESLPVDQFTKEYVFSTTDSAGSMATEYLNAIYVELPNGHNRVGSDYLDAASDDALSLYFDSDPDVRRLQTGSYTSSNMVSSDMMWKACYSSIRKCNTFINGIDRVPYNTTYTNALGSVRPLGVSYKAEARFLRAFFYFMLLERYGGVPLLGDKEFDLNDNLEIPRNTFAETVDYIAGELDDIQDSLRSYPMSDAANFAHVPTKQACIALKSRLYLYAASPLFNGETLEAGNEYVGYASYDASRWQRAAEVAKEFIDNYGLVGTKKSMSTAKFHLTDKGSYTNAFINYFGGSNHEIIFFRNNGEGYSQETNNGPLGFSGPRLGKGRTNPTQNFVDAFPMLDGKMRGESSKYPYDPQNPYANRDPRLDLIVLHQGSQWLGNTLQTYQGGANNPSSAGRYSQTSYFLRKFMGNCTTSTEYSSHADLWIYLRYGEILLNFAEAANEADDTYRSAHMDDILMALKTLRWRAGIEAGSDNDVAAYGLEKGSYGLKSGMTREELRKVIHNERRVELAFEEHRYFDIRRWREAEMIFRTPLQGMRIVAGSNSMNYSPIDLVQVNWTDKMYLYPIPYTEVNKNKNMVQNPNWK